MGKSDLQYKDVILVAKTEVGRSKDSEGNKVVEYEEVNISLNLPDNLEAITAEIGLELVTRYAKDGITAKIVGALRRQLKTVIAKDESVDSFISGITQENWKTTLKSEVRGTGGKKVREATERERNAAIDNIKFSLDATGRTIESLTEDEKAAINAHCGYVVF